MSLSLRSDAALKQKTAAASQKSEDYLCGLVWLYFSPSQHLHVSLTFHGGSQLIFGLLAMG